MAKSKAKSKTESRSGGVDVSAEQVSISGDVVGRDKIVNNIESFIQRSLTAAETAAQEREFEVQVLAQGVSAYTKRLASLASDTTDSTAGGPYKGLLAYNLADAELFVGRDEAITHMLQRLERSKLTVLHAESGAGKTSLLQAGLAPRLIGAGNLTVYLRPYRIEPALVLKRVFLADPGQTPGLTTAPLRSFLRQICDMLGEEARLYIYLDQFEEFFTFVDEPARVEFVRELAECLDDDSLNVYWVLSLRTEYFGNLANFRPHVRNPFENDYRLNRLTREEAREVMLIPAERQGLSFDDGLVDKLLDDLGGSSVQPPQIQLVLSALYESLPPDQKFIDRVTYDMGGGASGILRGHLDRVLKRNLSSDQRVSARRLLEALITSEAKRVLRTREELLAELQPMGVTPQVVDTVLTELVNSRLLRTDEVGPEGSEVAYELAHDYLLAEITVDPAVQARKAAQELLDQEVQVFLRYNTLLGDRQFAIIEARRAELVLNDDAKRLIQLTEKAILRKRRILRGGVGLAVFLVIVAALSVFSTIGAQQERVAAVSTQQAAEQEVVSAIAARQAADQAVLEAQERRDQAATAEAAAEQSAQEAEMRAARANMVVQNLFRKNGLIPVGEAPSALISDGMNVWVANQGNNEILMIDPIEGRVIGNAMTEAGPTGLAFDGTYMWVADLNADQVQVYDPSQRQFVVSIAVDGGPAALEFDGTTMWVANYNANTVQSIDVATRQVTGESISVNRNPFGMVMAHRQLWVANWGSGTIQSIDIDTRVLNFTTPIGTRPIAPVFDGRAVWVASQGNNNVSEIDPSSGAVLNTVTVGIRPLALVLYEGQLWVANSGDNTVQVINPLTGEVGAPIDVGAGPRALTFAGSRLWVANLSDNTVQAVDPVAGNLALPVTVAQRPRALTFDGNNLWVASEIENVVQQLDASGQVLHSVEVGSSPSALTFDGTYVWATNSREDKVQAIDPASATLVTTIDVGSSPSALAANDQFVWVTNRSSNSITAIERSTLLTSTIEVGAGPRAVAYDADHDRLWVANTDADALQAFNATTHVALDPVDTGDFPFAVLYAFDRVWVASQNANDVRVFNADDSTLIQTIEVGTAPVALASDGSRVWVANFVDNAIVAIDPDSYDVGTPIKVGTGPIALAFDGTRLWIAHADSHTLQSLRIN